MKINKEKSSKRNEHVPERYRVHIYDGTRVILFFQELFHNPKELIFVEELKPYAKYSIKYFKDKDHYAKYAIEMKHVYQGYIAWRNKKDFTIPIESEYVFKIITHRLTFTRNGIQFCFYRKSPKQTPMITPLANKMLQLRFKEDFSLPLAK